jgi:hypothetical protein
MIVSLAVTGLVYFVVMSAARYRTVGIARQAHIAPITIAERIKILHTYSYNRGLVVIQNVINVRLSKGFCAHYGDIATSTETSGRTWCGHRFSLGSRRVYWNGLRLVLEQARNSWGDDYLGLIGISKQQFVRETVKPYVSILFGSGADENYAAHSNSKGGSFSKVREFNVCPHLLSFGDGDLGMCISGPEIRPLVNLKLLAIVIDTFASQGSLPVRDSSIDDDCKKRKSFEPNFMGFTCPVFRMFGLVCGCILAAFGIVSLFLIWGKIGEYSATHVNVVLALGLLSSAGFIWLGQ